MGEPGDAGPGSGSTAGGAADGQGADGSSTGSVDDEGSDDGGSSGSAEAGTDRGGSDEGPGSGETTAGTDPPQTDVRNYIFGHSLVFNAQDANLPIWLTALAAEAGYTYGMSGQYGFASTHADELPPDPNWGIEGVRAIWNDGDGQSFADVGFNTVLFTEANFVQYLPPTEAEPGNASSVDNTLAVFDWVDEAQPSVRYLVYENWPDMAAFTDAEFNGDLPSAEEVAAYHAYTEGDFHQWWLDYTEALNQARPDLDIVLVPTGSVMSRILSTTLADVAVDELYLDNAPHGTPTLYFLAGTLTYMGMYGQLPPASYVPPESIHPAVRERFDDIVADAWSLMQE